MVPEVVEEMGVGTSEALGLFLAPPGTQTLHRSLADSVYPHPPQDLLKGSMNQHIPKSKELLMHNYYGS